MKNKKKLILLGVIGAIAVLIGACARSCILSFVNPGYAKVGTVSIPDAQMTISLYFGSMQEALIQPYDGVYRILEVSQRDKPAMYYDIPSLITMDRCRMEVYWYPTNNLIRFRDTELDAFARECRSECLLDLNQNIMFAVLRGNGVTHIARLSTPRDILAFPQSHNDERIAHFYSGDVSSLSSNSSATFMIGTQQSRPIYAPWTTNPGVLVGVLTPK